MVEIAVLNSVKNDIALMTERGLREADEIEIDRSSGMPVKETLERAYIISDRCYTVAVDGTPCVMFGLVEKLDPIGKCAVVWALATDDVDKVLISLDRVSKSFIDAWKDEYDLLGNWVDAENKKAIRWLKGLGFSFSKYPIPCGIDGSLFYYFEWRKQYV